MQLSRIFVYPIKAAGGIELTSAEIDDFGFRFDRRWMIVRPDGEFITQRDHSGLALLRTALHGDGVLLSADAMEDLYVPADPDGPALSVEVWNDRPDAADAGDEAAAWLSAFLRDPVRLVFMPERSFRRIDPAYSPEARRVSFTDGYPFLLVSEESVTELNRRSGLELSVRRFRPNLVVRGAAYPHAEDDWRRVRIGDLTFSLVKPCARCVVTTVDPDTGIAGDEPLRTLATYRRRNGKVYFAQNAIHDGPGGLRVGDEVVVID